MVKQSSNKPTFFSRDRSFLRIALVVIFAILAHSFDACASHLGTSFSKTVAMTCGHASCASSVPCLGANCICHKAPGGSDACELTSEVATVPSVSQYPILLDLPAVLPQAALPAQPQLIALSGCLYGLAGPPPGPSITSDLSTTLPDRAPPVLA